jgi:acyl dehydratase
MSLNYEKLLAHRPPEVAVSYGKRDCIVYALGIGLGMDPVDPGQLKFVYERDLVAFPTMAAVLGWMGPLRDPEFGIDNRMIVHADLKVTLHRPLQAEGMLTARSRIRDVIDKGPGNAAIIQSTRELLAADGTPVATIDSSSMARKHGGFGGKATSPEPAPIPDRAPDLTCDLATPPNLAALYRLNGDANPLHIDPALAKQAGFARPILHGAATFGIAAHAVLRTVADYDPSRLASIEARFARPVFPGDTLRTEMWRDGANVAFRCRVVERDGRASDEVVVNNGRAVVR